MILNIQYTTYHFMLENLDLIPFDTRDIDRKYYFKSTIVMDDIIMIRTGQCFCYLKDAGAITFNEK